MKIKDCCLRLASKNWYRALDFGDKTQNSISGQNLKFTIFLIFISILNWKSKDNFRTRIDIKLKFNFKLRYKFTFKFNFKFNFKLKYKFKLDFKLKFKFSFKFNIKFNMKLRFKFKVVIPNETNELPYKCDSLSFTQNVTRI